MEVNFLAVLVAALSTFVVGFLWYGPLFGKAWMAENGFTEEQMKKGNMFKIFGLTFVFSLMLAFIMQMLTIHQFGALGMIGGDVTQAKQSYVDFMTDYGSAYRTFKHGALHGFMSGVFIAFPIIGTNGLFEHKSWKYIFIQTGYWTVCMTIIGAIVCGWV
ncbi:DUF1761 domain-containing protein [Flavobacterium capsici]|uniref:DUF1761 domain-containing protein n=1 Tax=Flavobacterium capsici TaxID=3075618 RepID=A0AA96J3B6_9FLAO|nr:MULTISPECIES: DUF1761 domain-containing protein [unclassified Flavobacterium]WNM19138.1 DUF1761 domain-containing protein [Flavobacterium sp. PMR2A8]WNM20527.1 DUF1761 domain-containing protein [Flavobacterium sp. PMTSA4]